jgi:hypothetical protein
MRSATAAVNPRVAQEAAHAEPHEQRGDLRRRFAKPKNNFRKTLPMVPMGVHAREAKVLERRRGQCIANAGGGGIGIECASAHLIEHLSQVGFSHGK